jgi:hypothetical protein
VVLSAPLAGIVAAMRTTSYPTVDESRERLHHAGWSIGEAAFLVTPLPGVVWQVYGTHDEHELRVALRTQTEA